MSNKFDVLIIGSGVAGGTAAKICRQAGRSVAVTDHRPFGGTCPLRGCEPKKVLFDITDAWVQAENSKGHGLHGKWSIDWPELMEFKRSFTDSVPKGVEKGLARLGVQTFHGRARFTGPNTVRIDDQEIQAGKILIGTGAKPRPLSFKGLKHLSSSADFLELDKLPSRIVFVGGGYISFEFAHVAVRAGAKVDIIQRSDRCLKHFDKDLVALLCAHTQAIGAKVHYNAPIYSIEPQGNSFLVRAGESGNVELEADMVVHGAGRVAAVSELDTEAGSVAANAKGIVVNRYLQSESNPHVYAAGDVTPEGPQLTPVALKEAEIAAHNLLHGNDLEVEYSAVSAVLFTHPVMAVVGATEEELESKSIPFLRRYKETADWSPYRRLGESPAAAKVLLHKDNDTILGAHFLGHASEEVINVFALAIRQKIPARELKSMFWAYPSFGYTLIRHMLP
ncbi:MAG: dihydrolipoyl dehydrogenase family protein [Desulfovibrionales bacterium]